MSFILYNSDCLEQLKLLEDNSVDSIVTDPPYGLSFMGKKWDYDVPSQEIFAECLRVLKPGGHLLAFAGTRTQHRMAVRIEDAGFEIRDMIAWVYGSGFPKSLDVSKAIDKAAGAERGTAYVAHGNNQVFGEGKGKAAGVDRTPGANLSDPPVTESAKKWQGWGTALKPALEPITVARKPLIGTVAENVLAHGTGAININGCRFGEGVLRSTGAASREREDGWGMNGGVIGGSELGRWPANLIHDGSDEVVGLFPYTKSGAVRPYVNGSIAEKTVASFSRGLDGKMRNFTQEANEGSAARFFYCAKASKRDRDDGLEGFEEKPAPESSGNRLERMGSKSGPRANVHPTVKPTDLMRYLCRLVTPPNGIVLDPFMGSGSTGKAAMLEGFQFIGIEREAEYVEIAKARIENALNQNQEIEDDKQMTFL